jgi:lipopolysaccharide transport system ATP-binding protein
MVRAAVGGAWRKVRALASPGAAGDGAGAFWAVRDVSFDVMPGEVVGIIGHNGAGKSTLLKVLSRITAPTAGRVEIRGRMGSLLEVGTGFHPELTGRENVYLNGSILGMSRGEIRGKFDEIVAFSEIEKFLDTPVKRYSSGMYVRLAFAVAAHLDPEILVVDEVLAVGDAAFQKKCLDKMRAVSRDGRTVLVVSHQTDVIHRLCQRAVHLRRGQVVRVGPAQDVLAEYLAEAFQAASPGQSIDLTTASRIGTGEARFASVACAGEGGGWPQSGGPLVTDLTITAKTDLTADSLAVTLYDPTGFKLVNADSVALARPLRLRAGENRVRVSITAVHLNPGRYRVGLWLSRRPATIFDHVEAAVEITLVPDAGADLAPRANVDGVVPCEFDAQVMS